VSLSSEANYAMRMQQYMRAGSRVNSRVKVLLEWNEAGETHCVEACTIDVSPKGCLAIGPQGFTLGQKLRVRNRTNQKESDATLIWRRQEGRKGWELGLELVNPPLDFWGVEF
jgi:hypothetical protein